MERVRARIILKDDANTTNGKGCAGDVESYIIYMKVQSYPLICVENNNVNYNFYLKQLIY